MKRSFLQKNKGFPRSRFWHWTKSGSEGAMPKFTTGFTLVETLVAISILSISILGTFTAVQSGLNVSSSAKDQVTAFYLIQEAMELLRNKRDENAMANIASLTSGGPGVNWLTGISANAGDPCWYGSPGPAKTCRIDSPNTTINDCALDPGGVCPNLNQDISDPVNGTRLFEYNAGWPISTFNRKITLQKINANEVTVTVLITWAKGSYQISQSLFNTR